MLTLCASAPTFAEGLKTLRIQVCRCVMYMWRVSVYVSCVKVNVCVCVFVFLASQIKLQRGCDRQHNAARENADMPGVVWCVVV